MQKALIFVGIGVVVLGGAWLLLNSQRDAVMESDTMQKEEVSMMTKEEAMTEGADVMKDEMKQDDSMGDTMMKKGSYEPYSAEKIATAADGDVVLFFRASWCPTCKVVDADIKKNLSAIPPNLTILDVDYDNSQSLKQKYGVTYQHTFVQVDSKGNLIKKWSGSPTLSALLSEVQ